MKIPLIVATMIPTVLALACQRSAGPTSGEERLPLPCDVDRVLARNCRQCHGATPAFGAPMSLVTYDDLHAPSRSNHEKPVYEIVRGRVHDADHPMPPPPNPSPSSSDLATLDDWIAHRGSPGEACAVTENDAGADTRPPLAPMSCGVDVHLTPKAAYALEPETDEVYVCWGVAANVTGKRHIVGIAPRIDQTAVVHHLTLLQSDTPVSATPTACPLSGSSKWRSVYGWAPGAKALELPKEAGFPIDPSTNYVVQLHYSNPKHLALKDTSGVDLCTTDKLRPNDADIMAFGTQSFSIPPRQSLDLDCSIQVPWYGDTTHLFAAFPHMHKRGKSIGTFVQPSVGAAVDLGTVPHWSFDSQSWIPVEFVLRSYDVVHTRCSWNNETGEAIGFGEKTSDEMCYSFVMYWPRITHPDWHWSLPALGSICR